MTERLYLDRPDVYILARYHDGDARNGGRAQYIVCEHPDGAEYAEQLAAALGLLVMHGQEQQDQRGPGPALLASRPDARPPAA